MLTLGSSLLTDWSSLMGSCTLPLHCGTQGGSNIGTEGIPRTGEGRVKFILGGGIYKTHEEKKIRERERGILRENNDWWHSLVLASFCKLGQKQLVCSVQVSITDWVVSNSKVFLAKEETFEMVCTIFYKSRFPSLKTNPLNSGATDPQDGVFYITQYQPYCLGNHPL